MCALQKDLSGRYARHVSIPEIGVDGQKKIRNSRVLIVGCGGIGSAVIPCMAASGVGNLILCDDDTVRISNLNRQIVFKESDLGRRKVSVAAEFVEKLNSDVIVHTVDSALGPENFEEVFKGIDIVVDCVDRLAVKMFLNDACVALNKFLVHCVAIGFTGEVMSIPPGGKPCYRCFFEGQQVSTGLNCASSGIMAATVGVIGGFASAEVIKYIIGLYQANCAGKLHRVNLLENSFITYEFSQNEECACCGKHSCTDPYDKSSYEGKLR